MVSPQLNVRIPFDLNQKLNVFLGKTNMSKTEVVISALRYYMGLKGEDESLNQKLADIEIRLTRLEMNEECVSD